MLGSCVCSLITEMLSVIYFVHRCDSLIESSAMCVRAMHTEHNKQYRTEHRTTNNTDPNYQTEQSRTTQHYTFLTSSMLPDPP